MKSNYLACDLGAESGRLMLGVLNKGKLTLTELNRFPNTPVQVKKELHWDIPSLYQGLLEGLRRAAERDEPIQSISCDSWGLDYLLFDGEGSLITPAYHYRDPRCHDGVKAAFKRVSRETIFQETGIQHMPINTLFQLAVDSPRRLRKARHLLGVADGFNFLLSGVPRAEESFASTTQLFNPTTRSWSQRLTRAIELPEQLLPQIVPSGTRLGPLRPEVSGETGLTGVEVVAGCSHDTAAAVAAVPASDGNWAYLSSGTWSLMGVEVPEPILTDQCRDLNFTNEIGHGGRVRLLKNIIGLWILQECRQEWAQREEEYDYALLAHLAGCSEPFRSLINPNDPRFLSPGEMLGKVAAFCKDTRQPIPRSPGAFTRCILESLALLYRHTLHELEQVLNQKIETLHVVGGGSRNSVLNHFTAHAVHVPVVAGPAEATAAGNILVQAITAGDIPSLEAARQLIRASFPPTVIHPPRIHEWDAAYERFKTLILP
ncbi:MAG TPA: rhamnulokinase family protein [Methylomirabilota bacterium]|nr:rhamnulokinase family protein [Methylomirabilota bacterium]